MTALVISTAEMDVVQAILRRHVPEREVVCFGSRARGAARPSHFLTWTCV